MTIADVKKNAKIKLFYGKNNVNNEIIHIRDIIDENYVVYKVWSKSKQKWKYFIEHMQWFNIRLKYMKKIK
jgi:hypothetical protein